MFIIQLITNFFLFLMSVAAMVFNNKNILITIMCIELILLSLNLNFIIFSTYLDDFYGQLFSLFILTVAAAESAIGLAILIIYYRLRGFIDVNQLILFKR